MKNKFVATLFLIASLSISASSQGKSATTPNKPLTSGPAAGQNTPTSTRARVLTTENKTLANNSSNLNQTSLRPDLKNHTDGGRLRRSSEDAEPKPAKVSAPATTSTNNSSGTKSAPQDSSNLFSSLAPVSVMSTQIYRVGQNDVLDIQIAGNTTKDSTLFTVGQRGLLEYPLAGDPIAVVGLTTNEIASLLRQRIKIFDNPPVSVSVRDYASHAVTVTGFVAAPGRKVLRREAVPLYALLAEALVLPDAGRATITREGRAPIVADLKDSNHTSTLVMAGDVIRVTGNPPTPTEFFFVGGSISSPGQKPYHSGLTLTQALLASGGTTVKDARIRVSRLGPNGRLTGEDYNLRKIQSGKAVDPVLEKGDRIEVIPVN